MWCDLLRSTFRRKISTRSDEEFSSVVSSGTLIFSWGSNVCSSLYPAWLTPGLNGPRNNSRNYPCGLLFVYGSARSEMEFPPCDRRVIISMSDVCWRDSYGGGLRERCVLMLIYSRSLQICSKPITTRWCCWSSWHCWPLTCSSTPSVNYCGRLRSYSSCCSCECVMGLTVGMQHSGSCFYSINPISSILKAII